MSNDRPGDASPGGLLPRFDPATRVLAEALASFCKCDPSGGYGAPKLTALSLIHIVISGHTAPVYRNKSYFTQTVNQALVDEVISRSPRGRREGSELAFYVPDMGRFVGYKRGSGGFELTRDVTLRVHIDNCNNLLRVRNEVVTMHPGAPGL